jgi:hypothetical protein
MTTPGRLACALALLLAACGKSKGSAAVVASGADKIMSQRCPPTVDHPDDRVDELVRTTGDGSKADAARAEAVHSLACLLRMAPRGASMDPVLEVGLGIFTGGVSELFLEMSRHALVNGAALQKSVDALGDAFCDASSITGEVARRELATAPERVGAPALNRALQCPDRARAVAAIGLMETNAVAEVRAAGERMPPGMPQRHWFLPMAYGKVLDAASHDDDAAIRERATAALTVVGDAVYQLVVTWARSENPDELAVQREEVDAPLLGPALHRAIPAYRQRMADPSFDIRLAAAHTVWVLEGGSAGPSSQTLAAGLWDGLKLPLPARDPGARAKLQELVDKRDEGGIQRMLIELAQAGPASADALDVIRTCSTMHSTFGDVEPAADAALVLVGGEGAPLARMRKRYDAFFSDSPMAYGDATGGGETVAGAILYLEPDDKKARKALGLGAGPLVPQLTRPLIEGDRRAPGHWLIRLLLLREQGGTSP